MRFQKRLLMAISSILILSGCQNDDVPNPGPAPKEDLDLILSEELVLDPSGYAPLSAMLTINTDRPVRVDLVVQGKNGSGSSITKSFTETGDELNIPIHGLYADYNNSVDLTFFDTAGVNLGTKRYSIRTGPLIAAMPQITIDKAERERMAKGFTLVSYYGYSGSTTPQHPFMFDSYGDIRWYIDYADHPDLNDLSYNNGLERLANGNLYFAASDTPFVYEIDLFGTVVNRWEMPGFTFHHEVHEKPNGNFLVCATKNDAPTIEDYIVEIGRSSNQIERIWNLNESLDNSRKTLTDDAEDWVHVNAVTYDQNDDTIIVSGRTQGVIKLTNDNEVVWIMGVHGGWETAGNGTELGQYLLRPLDATGSAIADEQVLNGISNHPDFEWNWYQHAASVLPSGNIMLFDNGDNRNFQGTGTYSRAVEFEMNTADKTVRQVWQYGKERNEETYSRIVSDVDYLEEKDHVLFSPGAVSFNGELYGKSIEIDKSSGTVVYEATIKAPQAKGKITFHRTERLTLYPE